MNTITLIVQVALVLLLLLLIRDGQQIKHIRNEKRQLFNRKIHHVLTLYESALEQYRKEGDSESAIHDASREAALLQKELERAGPI